MTILDYREFLMLPEIKEAFEKMYSERKQYFRDKFLPRSGFDKEHIEVASIKMSFIETDLHFTKLHREKFRN